MDRTFLEEERRIDLGSIKKIDGNITQILDKTDNVAFYRFDGKVWHKQEIQGSIFVFSRSVKPYYGFIIQNRKSLSDNVLELLKDGLEFQRCNLYLLYKTDVATVGDSGIKSIWFEDEAGCIRISTLLTKLLKQRNECPVDSSSNNILSMFEKSKERKAASSPNGRQERNCRASPTSPHKGNNKKNNRQQQGKQGKRNQHVINMKHNNPAQKGEKKGDIMNLLSAAHKRYSNTTTCGRKSPNVTKPVTIMRRGDHASQGTTQPLGSSPPKKCETETSKEETVKSIPITFQDLVNSVQPSQNRRPLSCYSLDDSSSSSVEDIAVTTNNRHSYGTEKSSPLSSNSDNSAPPASFSPPHKSASSDRSNSTDSAKHQLPRDIVPSRDVIAPHGDVTHLVIAPRSVPRSVSMSDSAKLLMSPLDFKKVSTGPPATDIPTNVKKILFDSQEIPTVNSPEFDVKQFKRLILNAIEEDEEFLNSLYSTFQRKVRALR